MWGEDVKVQFLYVLCLKQTAVTIFYISPKVPIKIIPIKFTQIKKIKETKHINTKSQQNIKEYSKVGKERNYKTNRKQQNGNSKSFPIKDYLNVNGLNSPIRTHRIPEWILIQMNKQDPTICSLQETQFGFEDTHGLKVDE